MTDRPKILAVDDEVFNLDIIQTYLEEEGFEVICAQDGDIALQKLKEHDDIDIIILDRMMPRMNGMEVLAQLKQDEVLKNIPVIMQTAAASSQQILEGIQAGVYYYLTKPYQDIMLISIVKSALNDLKTRKDMREEVRKHLRVLGLMEQAVFRFHNLQELKNLVYFIANCFPDPENIVLGLNEIMTNALEHGNLGITYEEKTRLLLEGNWLEEVEKRLNLPENRHKYATLYFESTPEAIKVTIKDQGKGFNWQKYMEMSPDRANDPNGRGIALSKIMAFSSMEYAGIGNEVTCTVLL